MGYLNKLLRVRVNHRMRKNLINKDFSLITSNCNGTFMCHDLKLQYKSPFVNLWIYPKDYLKILSDLPGYMQANLEFAKDENKDYPVGILRDVKIYFQHYASEEEAYEMWGRRLARINYDNLFVLFAETDGCTYKDLQAFDALPYRNKVVFTHRRYPEIESAIPIDGFEAQGNVDKCYRYKNRFSGLRKYEVFDYVQWFNKGN